MALEKSAIFFLDLEKYITIKLNIDININYNIKFRMGEKG
jgi:hypothetical protein